MSVTDARVRPMLQLRVWYPGQGDPPVTYPMLGWYDVLAESHAYGTISRTAGTATTAGEQTLEYLEGIGLCCRPFLVQQSTAVTQYTTSGGTWETRARGISAINRLVQLDTTANLAWSALSTYTLQPVTALGFSLGLIAPPPDGSLTGTPPYVRIVLGLGATGPSEWALEWGDTNGGRLLKWESGVWNAVLDLPELEARANDPYGECYVLLRVLEGRICVSTDYGKSYAMYGSDLNPQSIRGGRLRLEGQNRQVVFGIHQLRYQTGTYTSPTRPYLPPWRSSASPDFTASRSTTPTGTTVGFTDLSAYAAGTNQYRATLTPANSGSSPFAQYRTPVLRAVSYVAAPVQGGFSGAYADYGANAILGAGIDKSKELDGHTLNVEIRHDGQTDFLWEHGMHAKAALFYSELDESGAAGTFSPVFVGQVRVVEVSQREYNKVRLRLTLDNGTLRLKTKEWTEFNAVPLGGRTLNSALDLILAADGIPLNPSYRQWHPLGDAFLLPRGAPEDPFEWPRRGETFWETLERLLGYAGLVPAYSDDGVLSSVPENGYDLFVSRALEASATGELRLGVQEASVALDCGEQATCVIVYGTDEGGGRLFAFALDTQAEQSMLSPRYSSIGRVVVQEELPGTCHQGMLVARCNALAYRHFRPRVEARIKTPLDPSVSRRDLDRISGLETLGVAAGDRWVVLTARHDLRPTYGDSSTETMMERLL